MYDRNFECTYHIAEDDKKDDEYRNNLLKIFQLTEFDEKIINEEIYTLFLQLKESEFLTKCMRKAASIMLSEDELVGFMILFSYDFLYLTIPCVRNLLKNSNEEYNEAMNLLNKKLFD